MNMASKSSKSTGRARSAITGRFVKKTTAARNPRTTVVEKPTKRSGK
jgi:hypothetical protein